jgi:hypothetical protein
MSVEAKKCGSEGRRGRGVMPSVKLGWAPGAHSAMSVNFICSVKPSAVEMHNTVTDIERNQSQ